MMTAVFILFIEYAQLAKLLVIGFGIIVLVYIIQDLAKADFFQEAESDSKKPSSPLIHDFAEKYFIENSKQIASGQLFFRMLLGIMVKALGPLVYVTVPKFSNCDLLVYNDKELDKTIESFLGDDKSLKLQPEQGRSFKEFFTADSGGHFNCENITILEKERPKEVFGYLLDIDYAQPLKERKRWMSFKILEVRGKKTRPVGNLFVHMFRGATVFSQKKLHGYPDPLHELLYIFIFGERSYVDYIKSKIEMNSVKAPSDIITRTINLQNRHKRQWGFDMSN
jgi:hypothetical protein